MLILLTETKHFPLTFCFVMSVGKKLFSTKFREGKKEKIYIHIKGGIMIFMGFASGVSIRNGNWASISLVGKSPFTQVINK